MKWTEAEDKTLKFNGNTVSAQPYMLDNYQSIDVHVASTASLADFYQINLHQEIWYNYPSPAAGITAMEAVVSTTTEYSPFIIYGANDNTTCTYSFNITDNHHTVVEGYSAENRVSCLASTTDQKKLYSLSGFDNDETGETE
ncbi:hypothetical protein TrLO_g7757 [Triparma laevis f. longispina]|uniref:Uncharacterized protein n=1 Tax=Triparma laevis f. longispina TaxID=1714387 RepID=A0A9W7FFQ5_9STRA|nr:hypothetical protein TrLO_g7757 [Triparma laevis f. longispina]